MPCVLDQPWTLGQLQAVNETDVKKRCMRVHQERES